MPKVQLQGSEAEEQGKESGNRGSGSALIKLMRPLNCLLASLAVLAGFNLVAPFNMNALWIALSLFLITGGGNVVNDFFDVDRDKINKPDRPLASGEVPEGFAVAFSIFLFSLGLFFAYLVSLSLFYLGVFASISLILYSGVIKEFKLLGNILVSVLVGLTFLAGSLAAGAWELGVNLGVLAFVVNWGREVFKDLEEEASEKWTLASVLNESAASFTAAGLVFWGILAAMAMGVGLNPVKRVLFGLAILSWISSLIRYEEPGMAQKFIKLGMGLIIVALLIP